MGRALTEYLFHHAEGVGDAAAAQHKDAGLRGRLFDACQRAQLVHKEPPARRGQHLGKADQRRRGAVGGGNGLADEKVGQWRQVPHQPCLGHLLWREFDKVGKGGDFFGQIAHVVEQQQIAVLQRLDALDGRRPGDVVDKADRAPSNSASRSAWGASETRLLIVLSIALVGQDDSPRARAPASSRMVGRLLRMRLSSAKLAGLRGRSAS